MTKRRIEKNQIKENFIINEMGRAAPSRGKHFPKPAKGRGMNVMKLGRDICQKGAVNISGCLKLTFF